MASRLLGVLGDLANTSRLLADSCAPELKTEANGSATCRRACETAWLRLLAREPEVPKASEPEAPKASEPEAPKASEPEAPKASEPEAPKASEPEAARQGQPSAPEDMSRAELFAELKRYGVTPPERTRTRTLAGLLSQKRQMAAPSEAPDEASDEASDEALKSPAVEDYAAEYTIDDVRRALLGFAKVVQSTGQDPRPALAAKFAPYNVGTVSDLPKDKYAEFIAALEAK